MKVPDLLGTIRTALGGTGTRGRLVRAGFGTVSASLAAALFAFVTSVVLARGLGAEGYGHFSLLWSTVLTIAVVARLGYAQPVIRDLAGLGTGMSDGSGRGLVRTSMLRVAAVGLGLCLLVVGFAVLVDISGESQASLIWAALMIPILALEAVQGAVYRGLGRVVVGLTVQSVVRPALFLIGVVLAISLGVDLDSAGRAMQLSVIAGIVTVLWVGWSLSRRLPKSTNPETSRWHFVGAGTFLALELMQVMSVHVDILVLGWLVSPDQLGVYKVVVSIGTLVLFFGSAAVVVVQPEISRLVVKDDRRGLQRLVTAQARVTTALTLVLVVLLALGGRQAISFVYGRDYEAGFIPLLLIAFGQLINVVCGPVGTVLNMSGHERDTVRGFAVGIMVTAALIVLLVPSHGILGAAIAHAAGMAAWNIYLLKRCRDALGIYPTVFGHSKKAKE